MKFKAEPNLYVRLSSKIVQRVTGLKGFSFDSNGEYETENPTLIRQLEQNFPVVEPEKPVETTSEPLKKCKKCDFTCDNQGELLAHHRTAHKKERE